jgi:hypothetical protein
MLLSSIGVTRGLSQAPVGAAGARGVAGAHNRAALG